MGRTISGLIDVVKLLSTLIVHHLPYFLMKMGMGLILGIILGALALWFSSKKGVFSWEAKSKGMDIVKKLYRPLMFLGVLFGTLAFFAYSATSGMVKKEIERGVGSTIDHMETEYLHDEHVRQQLFEVGKMVAGSGAYVKDINHALAQSSSYVIEKNMDDGFIKSQTTRFFSSKRIEDMLVDYEHKVVVYLGSQVAETMGMDGDMDFEDYNIGFDQWLNSGFKGTSLVIKSYLSNAIHSQVKSLIFGAFVPFILIGLLLLLLPIIHSWIAKRKEGDQEKPDIGKVEVL